MLYVSDWRKALFDYKRLSCGCFGLCQEECFGNECQDPKQTAAERQREVRKRENQIRAKRRALLVVEGVLGIHVRKKLISRLKSKKFRNGPRNLSSDTQLFCKDIVRPFYD